MAKKPSTTPKTASAKTTAPRVRAASAHDDHGHAAPTADGTISEGMDYAAHEAMFERFGGFVKWGMVIAAVLVIFLFVAIHPMIQTATS